MHLSAAIKAFFRVLSEGEPSQTPIAPAAPPPPPTAFQASADPAVQVLALLQKEGRLVDFLMEDISAFKDAEVGAAVRPIHAGCRKVLSERFGLDRVRAEAEGASVSVDPGFDASAVSVVGNVKGSPPYRGVLNHRGWRAAAVNLPTVVAGADPRVVAPAEIEVR